MAGAGGLCSTNSVRNMPENSICPVGNLKTNVIIVKILFSCPLGSSVSLWNFETIRGSLMKPNWQKLASLAQEICTL